MVDVDRRHHFALRRLSSRAASTPTTPTAGIHSFIPFASSLISQLKMSKIPLQLPGLSETELTKIESCFNLTFPPDLRTLLSLALPTSPSFPNWRSLASLSSLFSLPSLSLRSRFSRQSLKRAPILIPIFANCYLPARPCLAGNPVFYVDDDSFFCCAVDLQDFFDRFLTENKATASVSDGRKNPRWIDFWTDAAKKYNKSPSERSSFSSSSSSSKSSLSDSGVDPERFVEIRPVKSVPGWIGKYFEEIGGALRNGGWDEREVDEMVHVSESCAMDVEDEEVVKEVLVMRMDRWSEELRRAGWEGLDLGVYFKKSKKVFHLPPRIQFKFDLLVQEFVS